MFLVPKLAYLLQTSHLTQQMLYRIQQPYLRFLKNKINLPSMIGNYIITYKNMINCKLLWQELLTMQIANITKELNSSGRGKEVLELRLKQGLLQAGCVEGKISSADAKSSKSIWKTNLICLALSKAKELNLEFRLPDTSWEIEGTGPRIKDILGKKLFDRAFKSLRHLGLFYLHQLLNKKGELLILWYQLKYLRKQSSRGRKADWFKKIENAVLINRVT